MNIAHSNIRFLKPPQSYQCCPLWQKLLLGSYPFVLDMAAAAVNTLHYNAGDSRQSSSQK